MSHRAEIIRAAARAVYVQAWANWAEEQGESLHGELMDQAPKTPAAATAWARKLIKLMEKFNHRSIDTMYNVAESRALAAQHTRASISSRSHRLSPDNFGYCTAMQALGHGVSWSDDFPAHGYKIPHGEFYCHSARGCEGYVSDREGIGSVG